MAISIFLFFVAIVLGLSFYLGRKAKSAKGYFAAHVEIGWFVNGVAFAGDYLSAASFLGICGLIAFYGYDGFLYSIGFLAGWVVALFVIAEPIKRLGKFTFADALNSQFNSRGITLAAAFSTMIVSIFYLIPQMVGAGSLLKTLLDLKENLWHGIDLNHAIGVCVVGGVVMVIVVTAGMVSTTWVQFIKGSMLVAFCAMLTIAILANGIHKDTAPSAMDASTGNLTYIGPTPPPPRQVASIAADGNATGPLGPMQFVAAVGKSDIIQWKKDPKVANTWHGKIVHGSDLMIPGGYFKGVQAKWPAPLTPAESQDPKKVTDHATATRGVMFAKLDFVSLMLALFCGTASLPHILIRYYTVKDAAAARKSTVVGIGAIGFFYVLTLYIGLGAMVSGALSDDSNMAAPLLAKTFGQIPFAIITAIAFTTILGTVSGLIMAAAGAMAHDLVETVMGYDMTDHVKVRTAKIASIGVGLIAIVLGILFRTFNVSFLVGWAFNVAASANLPAIVMLLFWRRTTRAGMIWSILVGLFSSVIWLLLTKEAYQNVYGLDPLKAIAPFSQPGIVTIPLAFAVLVVVSLLTKNIREQAVVNERN
ncbi:hypothetical protein BH10PLA1_BH10PLA1_15230 [soil metagenome]